ncbi:MAG: NTP transferase domain-containing protein [Chthoniobacterales bacterium]
MATITEAVILMAGTGSRLRAAGDSLHKPLVPIRGRPLISYTLDSLLAVGIKTLHVVVGWESAALLKGLAPLIPAGIRLHPIENPEWEKQNGVSLLSAAPHLTSPFLLLMGDHLFEERLLAAFVREADPALLNLAIDRKIDSIFDLDDAMKVRTEGERVVAIGKTLTDYNAIDTGIFVCPPGIFVYLERALQNGDCSLADGVRLMAANDKMRALEIGDAWWQDVDDGSMLAEADGEAVRLTAPGLEREQSADRGDRA